MHNGSEEIPTSPNYMENREEIARKRQELLRLSEDGEIKQSVAQLKKASGKVILWMYEEYDTGSRKSKYIFNRFAYK